MATKTKKTAVKPVTSEDPTDFAGLLALVKSMREAQIASLPVREEPKDQSFIDQFHARLARLEKMCGTLEAEPAVRPHPDDDPKITRITPPAETFDLKEKSA